MDNVVAAMAEEGRALLSALDSVDDFSGPTNCPPWTLGELVVHIGSSIRIPDLPAVADASTEAADYYRRPERATEKYRQDNVAHGQHDAGRILATMSPTAYFENAFGDALDALQKVDLRRSVEIARVGPMPFEQWLITRLISIAAHGLDVAISLDRPPWTTAAALRVMRPVFVSLLDGEPPIQLGWSDLHFFEVSTGRRQLTDDERPTLGSSSPAFPLLS